MLIITQLWEYGTSKSMRQGEGWRGMNEADPSCENPTTSSSSGPVPLHSPYDGRTTSCASLVQSWCPFVVCLTSQPTSFYYSLHGYCSLPFVKETLLLPTSLDWTGFRFPASSRSSPSNVDVSPCHSPSFAPFYFYPLSHISPVLPSVQYTPFQHRLFYILFFSVWLHIQRSFNTFRNCLIYSSSYSLYLMTP